MAGNNKLRALIALKGYRQKEFAELCGMRPEMLSCRINGKTSFTESDIRIICEALNVSPMEIFFDGLLINTQQEKKSLINNE